MHCKLVGFRSSHQRWSVKKGALKNFSKFAEKHLYWSPFFNKVAGLTPATLLKKTLWHKCFPVKFGKFLGTIFFQNTSERLLHWFLLNELTKSCLLKCIVSIATKMVSFLGPARLTKCVSVIYLIYFYLTHFRPIFPFRTPWRKTKKPKVFSGVFRGHKMGNWQEMRLVTSINPFLLKLLIRKFQKINQILLHKNEAVVTCSSVKIAFQS